MKAGASRVKGRNGRRKQGDWKKMATRERPREAVTCRLRNLRSEEFSNKYETLIQQINMEPQCCLGLDV